METITLQQAYKLVTSRKSQTVSFKNKQTGLIFTYSVIQAEYDPIDPMSRDLPPQFIFSQIGSGEWAYMGALYQDKDYVHYEGGIFPNDYPCVKIWRYMLKMMIINREVEHIETFEGVWESEDELDCEQVQNMQYGAMRSEIVAGEKSLELSNNFLKPKTRTEMHIFLKQQLAL